VQQLRTHFRPGILPQAEDLPPVRRRGMLRLSAQHLGEDTHASAGILLARWCRWPGLDNVGVGLSVPAGLRCFGIEADGGDAGTMAKLPALGFAELLRQLRAEARLTQEELAMAAGLSLRSVSDLERGINHTPSEGMC